MWREPPWGACVFCEGAAPGAPLRRVPFTALPTHGSMFGSRGLASLWFWSWSGQFRNVKSCGPFTDPTFKTASAASSHIAVPFGKAPYVGSEYCVIVHDAVCGWAELG